MSKCHSSAICLWLTAVSTVPVKRQTQSNDDAVSPHKSNQNPCSKQNGTCQLCFRTPINQTTSTKRYRYRTAPWQHWRQGDQARYNSSKTSSRISASQLHSYLIQRRETLKSDCTYEIKIFFLLTTYINKEKKNNVVNTRETQWEFIAASQEYCYFGNQSIKLALLRGTTDFAMTRETLRNRSDTHSPISQRRLYFTWKFRWCTKQLRAS